MTELLLNPFKTADPQGGLSADAHLEPMAMLAACPAYAPTPLVRLPGLARHLGVGQILVKNESKRMGLGSFKALGGVYAVFSVVRAQAVAALGRTLDPAELVGEKVRAIASDMHFVCASDGNHGRAVAAGARLVGARCSVYLHAGVTEERADHIRRQGAAIVRIDGTYDDSVEQARRDAARTGAILVSDTADAPECADDPLPVRVMQGYTVIAEEIRAQLSPGERPTHLFVQAGVGGLAAAMASRFGGSSDAPRIIVVEPDSADCLLESARAGGATEIVHSAETIFAMLDCLRPSLPAFAILKERVDAFISVADTYAAEAVCSLAAPAETDTSIRAGASGAAGLAGALAANDLGWREAIGMNGDSALLFIITEGVTDEAEFQRLTASQRPER
jgi:diaminopropionate ammonia-lyase